MAGTITGREFFVDDGLGEVDPSLSSYIASLIANPAPLSPVTLEVRPTIRRWEPVATARSRFPLVDRHPLFVTDDTTVEARKPPPLSRTVKRGWRGVFHSRKVRRPVYHYTGLELHLFRFCEVDQSVTSYLEHPARIKRPDAPENALLPLSAYVERNEEQWFIICRWEKSAARPESERVWAQVGNELSAAGIGFEVVTENHFRQRPVATNVETLLRGRWFDPPPNESINAVRSVACDGGTVGDACISSRLSIGKIWQLVLDGAVGVDLTGNVDENSRLYEAPLQSDLPLWSAF